MSYCRIYRGMNMSSNNFNINVLIFIITLFVYPGSAFPGGEQNSDSYVSPPGNRLVKYTEKRQPCADYEPNRKALFGELHVHTGLSFDAVAGRIDIMPEDAYRFAKGELISFFPQDKNGKATGRIRIDRPLDFVAITDHSELLGERQLCVNSKSSMFNSEFCTKYRDIEWQGTLMLASVITQKDPKRIELLCGEHGEICLEASRQPWQKTIKAAEVAYDRSASCEFTTFVGYEYTGTPENSNYHRNVIFRNGNVPDLPISYIEAPKDYMLWKQLNSTCSEATNCDYITIPHNSNLSNGKLLRPYADLETTLANRKNYAMLRQAAEPMMEIFQHKGSSECINGLSSVLGAPDELCNFEQVRKIGGMSTAIEYELIGTDLQYNRTAKDPAQITPECTKGVGKNGMFGGGCISKNDFLRTALLTGLEEEQEIGINPVKLGVVASTDGHAATPGSVAEDNWRGHVTGEMSIQERLSPGTLPSGILGNPGGIAGVWAVENSRDAIFDAFKRKEVFGTSGPRIAPRFFGGWHFPENLCQQPDLVEQGYVGGTPMGGDLSPPGQRGQYPKFITMAMRDPLASATKLQKLQLIKGWVDREGRSHYKVYDIAGEPSNAAGVDLQTGKRYGKGYDIMCTVYTDKEFDLGIPAYYYLRVVENPSPRWSLNDCIKLNTNERPELCGDKKMHVIQEMAWTSPIWYSP